MATSPKVESSWYKLLGSNCSIRTLLGWTFVEKTPCIAPHTWPLLVENNSCVTITSHSVLFPVSFHFPTSQFGNASSWFVTAAITFLISHTCSSHQQQYLNPRFTFTLCIDYYLTFCMWEWPGSSFPTVSDLSLVSFELWPCALPGIDPICLWPLSISHSLENQPNFCPQPTPDSWLTDFTPCPALPRDQGSSPGPGQSIQLFNAVTIIFANHHFHTCISDFMTQLPLCLLYWNVTKLAALLFTSSIFSRSIYSNIFLYCVPPQLHCL